jgi:HK97 family phage major capsid protein
MKFKDIESARKRYNQLVTAMQAIVGGEGDNMTAEQKTTFDAFKNEAEQILKDYPTVNVPDGVLSLPDNGQGNYTQPAKPKRCNLKNFKDAATAFRFGKYVQAICGNPAAIGWCASNGINIYATSHSEGSNPLGGYTVPEQFSNVIIDLRQDYGVFRQFARIAPMTSDTLKIPRRATGLTGYWVAENAAFTESNKTWNQVQLSLKKLGVIARMSNELAEDAITIVADDLAGEIAYSLAYSEDMAGFVGDGTSTYGGITGVTTALKAAAGTPTTFSAGGVRIAAGNAFSEITLGNLTGLIGLVLPRALKSARWYCSPVFYADVMLRLIHTAGGLTGGDIVNGLQQSFLGYPVTLTPTLPSTDANSQIVCLFGDLGLAATMGDRSGISLETSKDAVIGGESTFERDQTAIRGRERVDIVVHDVGSTTAGGPVVGLQTLNS